MGELVFPLAAWGWTDFAERPELRGADDGAAGRGGWGFRRNDVHVHRGIDLKAPIGALLVAVEDGIAEYLAAVVGSATNMAGHVVRLTGRSGAGYRYFHLGTSHASTDDAFAAGARGGDVVEIRAGSPLGYLGHTGGSKATGAQMLASAAHLHFQYHPTGLTGPDANPARLFERIAPARRSRR